MKSKAQYLGRRSFLAGLLAAYPLASWAAPTFEFQSIDGGVYQTADWIGRPVLVVNTASRCAFTKQYDGLQALYDRYRDKGLIVLSVPSQDFRQELKDETAVKEFCELNFDLDLPMTTITSVRGSRAHPFYQWVKAQTGFSPKWNFNKVLLAPSGEIAATWRAPTAPLSSVMTSAIEGLLVR